MLTSIEGVYRDDKIELAEQPADLRGDVRVIDLPARGIDMAAAHELRNRLASFADEWNSPEMDIYNTYPCTDV